MLADAELLCEARERRRADEAVLHARQFAFGKIRMTMKQVIGDDHAEHGIANELHRFVVQAAGFRLVARFRLFVRPRAMRQRSFEKGEIGEAMMQGGLQLI